MLRSAHYRDETEEVDFGELHLFVGPNFVLTVRHSQTPDLAAVRHRLEDNPDLLRLGPEAVLYAMLDAVVDGYAPVVTGLQTDIDEIQTEVFGRHPKVSRRIYELSREVVEFQRATRPSSECSTVSPPDSPNTAPTRNCDATYATSPTTPPPSSSTWTASAAYSPTSSPSTPPSSPKAKTRKCNASPKPATPKTKNSKDLRRAAILFAPTLTGTVYGMNFRHMPELGWALGYPFALLLMAAVCAGLYLAFKRGWL